jgi:hypothetical protein
MGNGARKGKGKPEAIARGDLRRGTQNDILRKINRQIRTPKVALVCVRAKVSALRSGGAGEVCPTEDYVDNTRIAGA